MGEERLAVERQLDAPRRAGEQSDAQLALESRDPLRDGLLSHPSSSAACRSCPSSAARTNERKPSVSIFRAYARTTERCGAPLPALFDPARTQLFSFETRGSVVGEEAHGRVVATQPRPAVVGLRGQHLRHLDRVRGLSSHRGAGAALHGFRRPRCSKPPDSPSPRSPRSRWHRGSSAAPSGR